MSFDTLRSVKWRTVTSVRADGYGQKVYADGNLTLQAALLLARRVSETYHDVTVHVHTGKRLGRWTATFIEGDQQHIHPSLRAKKPESMAEGEVLS